MPWKSRLEQKYDKLQRDLRPVVTLPIMTDGQKTALNNSWNAYNQKMEDIFQQRHSEFENSYRLNAIEYKEELWHRLSIKDYGPFSRTNLPEFAAMGALSTGTLAGIHPLSDLATYLEGLANKLPP